MIVTFDQQQSIKKMGGFNSTNAVAQARYTEIASEVEELDVDLLLGSRMYQEIRDNLSSYADLLDGSEFTDCTDTTIKHKGLRYVIAYLNYAKYIGCSYVNDTWTGLTQKTRQDSERLTSGDIKRLQQENRQIGFNAFLLVKDYIIQDDTLSALYTIESKRTKTPKLIGIRNI